MLLRPPKTTHTDAPFPVSPLCPTKTRTSLSQNRMRAAVGVSWQAGGGERGPRQREGEGPEAAFIFEVMTDTRFEIGAKLSFVSLTTSSLVFEVCATAASNAFLLFSA